MAERPWPLSFRPSAWDDPLDPAMAALMPAYNAGRPRQDLSAVEALLAASGVSLSRRRVVVVGTNGKSSTATYLARIVHAAGHRVGLYTSPHLRRWAERIQVDLEPVPDEVFARSLARLHEVAQTVRGDPGQLRFFDVLTFAAQDAFEGAGVEVAVFEAGIGGRLDATACLRPQLVLLTSLGADHEELLGDRPEQRLREKALVAPPGATLISAPLGAGLEAQLRRIGDQAGFAVRVLDAGAAEGTGPAFQRRNLALARAGARALLGDAPLPPVADAVAGRFQRGQAEVPYVVDVAHNPTAWHAFLGELPALRHVVVTAITRPRPVEALARELAAASAKVDIVIATSTVVRPAQPPGAVAEALAAAGLAARAIEPPEDAFAAAVALARARGLPLAVFGSNFLAVDFLAWVRRLGHASA